MGKAKVWRQTSVGLQWLFCLLLPLVLSGCPAAVAPVMAPDKGDFFAMPWPNAMRTQADGSLDFRSFTGSYLNPLSAQALAAGAPTTFGFGVNTGGYFRFSGSLSTASLPDVKQTLQADSAIMLVNIDPQSPQYLERVPLRLDFQPIATLYRPGNVLAYLPYRGYSLAAEATYAAIVFTRLTDENGVPIEPAPLLAQLREPTSTDTGGWTQTEFATLRNQYQQVEAYVEAHTDFDVEQIAAFTVYRTQNPVRHSLRLKDAVARFSDEEIMASVIALERVERCSRWSDAYYEATIRLPRWQHGPVPYLISGGGLLLDEQGIPLPNGSTQVRVGIAIGCDAIGLQRPLVVLADGTGGSYQNYFYSDYFLGSGPTNHVFLSVSPLFSDDRVDFQQDALARWLEQLDVPFDSTMLAGFLYYNYINTVGAIGSQMQSAADSLYLARLGLNLNVIFNQFGMNLVEDGLHWPELVIDSERVGLIGQSQGASAIPVALANEPLFSFAMLNGLAGHAYPQMVYRGSVRTLLNQGLFGMVAAELNEFHPFAQFVQTFYEPADPVNYAPYINTRNLLITAGYHDNCVVRESSGSVGFAYARYGKLQVTRPFPGYDDITGLGYLQDEAGVALPLYDANKPDGGIGLFSQDTAGHYLDGQMNVVHGFMDFALGYVPYPLLPAPDYSSTEGDCDFRYE